MKVIIHIIWLSILSLSFLTAQSIADKRELRAMFDKKDNLWFKKYHGYIDGIHPLEVIVATDGSLWKGWYTMNEGSFKMSIEGSSAQNKLTLYELNPSHDYCAQFTLNILGEDLSGMWHAVLGDQHFTVELSQNQQTTNHCNESKISIYSTFTNNKSYQLNLTTEGKHIIDSKLSINSVSFDLELKCQNEDCSKLYADLSEFGGATKEVTIIKSSVDQLNLRLGKADAVPITLLLKESLDFKCLRFSNFKHKIDLVYPVIHAEVFNNWIISEFRNTIELSSESIDLSDMDCHDRWSNHSFGWVDIHYFDEEIISGILVYQLADKELPMTKSFVYDLKENKKLSDQALFDKKSNYQAILRKEIANYKTHMVRDHDKSLEAVYKDLPYPHISLSDEGIILSADYSSIWGSQNIYIPYGDLADDLHKSISKKFIKK